MAGTHLSVVTPASTKFEGDVDYVIAPGSAGNLAALPKHAPMLTTLRPGIVQANVASSSAGDGGAGAAGTANRVEFAVDGGFLEILPHKVIILTDSALSKDEIDATAAREELRRADEALAQKKGTDDAQQRRAVAWAQTKLELKRPPAVE